MNNDTVLKCAEMAAAKQRAFLGYVDQDIQDLIAELTAPAPAPKTTTTKVVAQPVAEPAAE